MIVFLLILLTLVVAHNIVLSNRNKHLASVLSSLQQELADTNGLLNDSYKRVVDLKNVVVKQQEEAERMQDLLNELLEQKQTRKKAVAPESDEHIQRTRKMVKKAKAEGTTKASD